MAGQECRVLPRVKAERPRGGVILHSRYVRTKPRLAQPRADLDAYAGLNLWRVTGIQSDE